jgi:hypothetical protein
MNRARTVAGAEYNRLVSQSNGKIKRLTPKEVAALTTPAKPKTREERHEAVRRATEGLRAEVRVTRSMYRPR